MRFLINEDINSNLLVNAVFDKDDRPSFEQDYIGQKAVFLEQRDAQGNITNRIAFNTPLIHQIQEVKKNTYVILYSTQTPQNMLFEERCQRVTEWKLAIVTVGRNRDNIHRHASTTFTTPIDNLVNRWNTIHTSLTLTGQNLIRSDYSNYEWNTEYGEKAYDKDIAINIAYGDGVSHRLGNDQKNRLKFSVTGRLANMKFEQFSMTHTETGNQNNLSIKKCVRRIASSVANNHKLEIEQVTHRNKLLIRLSLSHRTITDPEVELHYTYYQDGIWKDSRVAKISLKPGAKANQFSGVFYSKDNGFTHGSIIKAVYLGNPQIPPLSTWISYAFH
jgi:hypothetical protein